MLDTKYIVDAIGSKKGIPVLYLKSTNRLPQTIQIDFVSFAKLAAAGVKVYSDQ